MKSLIGTIALSLALVTPVASFAKPNQPLTRAQVRAELVQLEKAGYNPGANDDATYPVEIQAAEARVAAQNSETQASAAQAGGYGSSTNGSSESGGPHASTFGIDPVPAYEHH